MATNSPPNDPTNRDGYAYEPTERPARDTEDWLEAIGPEDEDRETVLDGLEDYGFDIMDDDDELSLETGQGFVGGYANGAYQDIEEVGDTMYATPLDADANLSERPVEDDVLDDIDPTGDPESEDRTEG